MTRDEAIATLPAAMQRLYGGAAYYVSIPPGEARPDFWKPRADPDGAVRDVACEHSQFRDDNAEEIRWVSELVPGRALDVGAGSGRMVRVLNDLGWTADAVEPDDHGATLCRAEGAAVWPHLYAAAESCRLQYVDRRQYSLVTWLHVIEHMPDPVEACRVIMHVLAPGGSLIVSTSDFDSHTARRFGPRYRLLHDPTHISLFSTDSLLRLLRDTGFTIERVHHPFWEQARFDHHSMLLRQLNPEAGVSPAAPGNLVSVLARKPV